LGQGMLHFGDPQWTDYDVQVQMMTHSGKTGNHAAVVHFRVTAWHTRYNFDIGRFGGGSAYLSVLTNNKGSGLAEPVKIQHIHDRWYEVKIELRGPRIRCFVDGLQVFDHTDAKLPSGMIGFETATSSVRLKNLTVTAPDGTLLWEGFPDVSKL
ncbi:MAG: family 16 glycoside hydrolase, partial [Planctomycetota bacterium]